MVAEGSPGASGGPTVIGRSYQDAIQDWEILRSESKYFFQTPEWIMALHHQISDDAIYLSLIKDDLPISVIMLRRLTSKRLTMKLKMLTAPGTLSGLRLFSDGIARTETGQQISSEQISDGAGSWDVLHLQRLRIGSPWLTAIRSEGLIEDEPEQGVGILDTNRASEVWWDEMPKNMRHSVEKSRRKLVRLASSEVIVESGSSVLGAFSRYVELENSQRKGAGGTSLRYRPEFQQLLSEYLQTCQNVQIRTLMINGAPAAIQVGVIVNRTYFLIKIAYDEALSSLSPGNVLMANLIEEACGQPSIDRIDCLVWQPWHQRWGMIREPTSSLTLFNRSSLKGRLASLVWPYRHYLSR